MSLQWKMHTNFPFSRVFVLGVILFCLGLASMIISIIGFVTQSWGNYVGTGMWGGATVLTSGITAVFVSRSRSLASVKAFCVCSVIAMFTSLTMLILSAGGLTLNSGFYSRIDLADYNKRTSNLIHASLLVISVFCLSGSVLAVIVCCKYLFFEHYDKPKRRRHHRNLSESTSRTSNTLRGGAANGNGQRSINSRTSLHINEQISRRHSDLADVNRVQIEYRRSHKRSASDQPHANSHSRRQKHCHHDINPGSSSNNTNSLFPGTVRYYPDRQNGSNRSCSQGRDVRGNSREPDRQNFVPARQTSSRPTSQVNIQPQLPRNSASASPKVRLPTEFNEEELPPYEAVEATGNAISGTHSDSGDESDTENSSTTDAHSYNAGDDEGTEAVPMIEIGQLQQTCSGEGNSRQHKTTNCMPSNQDNIRSTHVLPEQSCAVLATNDHTELVINRASCDRTRGAGTIRKDLNRSVFTYSNTHPSDQRDCEHLLSVSPEVCAITGESPELSNNLEDHVPHLVEENFYENGPCYENISCSSRNIGETTLNHLSKSSSANLNDLVRNGAREKEDIGQSVKKVPIHIITCSSPVSNTSPQSPLSSFGSPLSAFRPVASTLSVHSPVLHVTNDGVSPRSDDPDRWNRVQKETLQKCNNAWPLNKSQDAESGVGKMASSVGHMASGVGHMASGVGNMYVEQGAIPKTLKNKENDFHDNSCVSMSWKNIPLPLSYNHSQSASNEPEKKLPSKTIPFADSDPDISKPSTGTVAAAQNSSSKMSSHNYLSKNPTSSSVPLKQPSVSTSKCTVSSDSPFGAAAEALLAKGSHKGVSETAVTHPKQTQSVAMASVSTSSVREASTQVNSGSTSRWHAHRMGGNQSLLQSRREELHNCQLSNRTVEASNRAARPTSMPVTGALASVSHGVTGLAVDRQVRNRFSEASPVLANHQGQQVQPLSMRQNHLMQHYPLQPQQPRLGVQLHQRRQQQHQLQQNIESQQQHQQLQQQQQQLLQQGNQQNVQAQQGRNGRPLFSVLL